MENDMFPIHWCGDIGTLFNMIWKVNTLYGIVILIWKTGVIALYKSCFNGSLKRILTILFYVENNWAAYLLWNSATFFSFLITPITTSDWKDSIYWVS